MRCSCRQNDVYSVAAQVASDGAEGTDAQQLGSGRGPGADTWAALNAVTAMHVCSWLFGQPTCRGFCTMGGWYRNCHACSLHVILSVLHECQHVNGTNLGNRMHGTYCGPGNKQTA